MTQVKLEVITVKNIIERLEDTVDVGQSSPGFEQDELKELIEDLEKKVESVIKK